MMDIHKALGITPLREKLGLSKRHSAENNSNRHQRHPSLRSFITKFLHQKNSN